MINTNTKTRELKLDGIDYLKALFDLMKPRVMSLAIFTCVVGLLIAHSNIDYLYGPINSGSSLSTSDVESLINFVRGYDSYDEDKNNNTLDERNSKLADIFHSKLQIISPPSIPSGAESEKIKKLEEISNSEAAYRKQFGYESFKSQQGSRKKIVLVGSNGGMLHAFDDASGEELWAFIPPNIHPRLREIISSQDYETNSIWWSYSN